jgi:hypothetical protein
MNARTVRDSGDSVHTPQGRAPSSPRGRGRAQVGNGRVSQAATSHARTPLSPLVVFKARCEARALLYAACVFADLPTAIDPLQAFAVESGLVEQIGQDAVQAILADAFHAVVRGRP